MFCTNCGKEMEDGDLFCTNCGTRVEKSPEVQENTEISQGVSDVNDSPYTDNQNEQPVVSLNKSQPNVALKEPQATNDVDDAPQEIPEVQTDYNNTDTQNNSYVSNEQINTEQQIPNNQVYNPNEVYTPNGAYNPNGQNFTAKANNNKLIGIIAVSVVGLIVIALLGIFVIKPLFFDKDKKMINIFEDSDAYEQLIDDYGDLEIEGGFYIDDDDYPELMHYFSNYGMNLDDGDGLLFIETKKEGSVNDKVGIYSCKYDYSKDDFTNSPERLFEERENLIKSFEFFVNDENLIIKSVTENNSGKKETTKYLSIGINSTSCSKVDDGDDVQYYVDDVLKTGKRAEEKYDDAVDEIMDGAEKVYSVK